MKCCVMCHRFILSTQGQDEAERAAEEAQLRPAELSKVCRSCYILNGFWVAYGPLINPSAPKVEP